MERIFPDAPNEPAPLKRFCLKRSLGFPMPANPPTCIPKKEENPTSPSAILRQRDISHPASCFLCKLALTPVVYSLASRRTGNRAEVLWKGQQR